MGYANSPFQMAVPQEPGTKEPQMSINKSNIKVPVDIQDALEIKEELYAADGTNAQSITMDKRGYKLVQASWSASVDNIAHRMTLEYSFDNVTWFTEVVANGVLTSWNYVTESAARYWRFSVDAQAGAHTENLVLGAVP